MHTLNGRSAGRMPSECRWVHLRLFVWVRELAEGRTARGAAARCSARSAVSEWDDLAAGMAWRNMS